MGSDCATWKDRAPELELASGNHYDAGKVRLDLVPAPAIWAIGEVFTHGANKYSDRNWEGGILFNRLFGSALRHLWSWWRGETIDPESGLNHLAHAACNICMLLDLTDKGMKELDNRPVRPETAQKGQT